MLTAPALADDTADQLDPTRKPRAPAPGAPPPIPGMPPGTASAGATPPPPTPVAAPPSVPQAPPVPTSSAGIGDPGPSGAAIPIPGTLPATHTPTGPGRMITEGSFPPPRTLPDAAPPALPTIDPTNDLRNKMIDGADDSRTAGYAGQVDDLAKNLPTNRADLTATRAEQIRRGFGNTDVTAGPSVGPTASSRLTGLQGQVDAAAGGVAGVDRVALAQKVLAQFRESQKPETDYALRQATAAGAAQGLGRSGQLRTRYGNIADEFKRIDSQKEQSLINDAVSGSIEDQFRKTGVLLGLEGQIGNEEAAARGEQRTERGYNTDVATGNVTRAANIRNTANTQGADAAGAEIGDTRTNLSTIAGLEDNARRTAQERAAALRGERGYQVGQEDASFRRTAGQQQTEFDQQGEQQRRALQLLGAGESGNPADLMARLSGMGLDPATIQQLMQQIGQKAA